MISINIVKFFEAIKLDNFFYLHSMNYVFFLWTKPGQNHYLHVNHACVLPSRKLSILCNE